MKSSSKINDTIHYRWRAVDQHGNVLDVLVQSRRHAVAAINFFRRLLTLRYVPRVLVTDKLAGYRAGPPRADARAGTPAIEVSEQSGRKRPSASSTISMRGNMTSHGRTLRNRRESQRSSAGYVRRTVFGAQGKPNRSGNAQG
jgi:transposase-like protein